MKGCVVNKLSLGLLAILAATFLYGEECAKTENITLKIGQSKTIVLPANHTTGYSWQMRELMAQDRKVVDVGDPEYIQKEHAKGMVGVGGFEHWTFKGVQKGTVKILFEYLQRWNPDSVVKEGELAPREYHITVK